MKSNLLYPLSIKFIVLTSLVACTRFALPPSPSLVQTSVAGTSQAASTPTEQASLVPATPAATFVPTETLVPTPKISWRGTSLILQKDQSSLFVDHTAGIQLEIPPGWLPVRVDEDEYYKAFSLDVVLENPPIRDRLTAIQDAKPDVFRLDAIDIRPGHIPDGLISNMDVIFEKGDMRTLEKWEQAERNRKSPFAHFKFISSSYPHTNNGTRVLLIEESWSAGDSSTVYYRGVFFPLSTGTIVLDFFTNSAFKDTVLPDFDQVVNSLTPLGQ